MFSFSFSFSFPSHNWCSSNLAIEQPIICGANGLTVLRARKYKFTPTSSRRFRVENRCIKEMRGSRRPRDYPNAPPRDGGCRSLLDPGDQRGIWEEVRRGSNDDRAGNNRSTGAPLVPCTLRGQRLWFALPERPGLGGALGLSPNPAPIGNLRC